ncbi:MAG: hypothetical protein C4527_28060 [Candidatus Omnitrophota bacterium]|jgi:Na+/proline symporter|nr:MAG: hypothetical protein C4527_28060 [Candidatus Omnitrophota bacterium]
MNLHPIDLSILILYLGGIVIFGFCMRRRASESLDEYFLAGRRLHWLYISLSGSVSTFDITGTMWIVAMFYTMGMKGMWIHWFWGFLMPAFFMTYAGKWVRRSNVITGAQWLCTRFGEGTDGRIARVMYAILSLIFTVGMIGYAFQGIGKFSSVYLPVSETTGATLIIGVTSLYVILGGFYSVIFTDVVQTIILTIAAIIVAVICYNRISYDALAAAVPDGWLDLMPSWQPEYLADTEYQFFGMLCIAWVLKGFLLNAGGPGQLTDFQRFLSTRTARDSCKVGAAWCFFLISRWGMCMGITALAMIGIEGITDAEKVLPHVLNTYLPIGLKGIVLAGFFAAFMSTFDSTINTGASYLVKDIYQAFLRQRASQRELAAASYLASLLIVMCGVLMGLRTKSIAEIWNWLMMVFGAGFLVPNLLRWYWWRFNAWGVVASLLTGMLLCFYLTNFHPDAPFYVTLYIIVGGSLLAAIVATLATPPTNLKILQQFYITVQPGGFWGPVRRALETPLDVEPNRIFFRDLLNAGIAMVAITSLYLLPVYAVIHAWTAVYILSGIFFTGFLLLSIFWYPYLPKD